MPCHLRNFLCLLFGLGLLSCKAREPALAHLGAFSGTVTVHPSSKQASTPAEAQQPLFLEDVVTTGPDGKATVEFNGSNAVELGPGTSLVIRRSGGATAEIGAILLSGSVKARGGGQGVVLAIGTPFGLIEVGAKVSILDIGIESGVAVQVGEVAFVKDGQVATVTTGQGVTVAGLVVALAAGINGVDVAVQKAPVSDFVLKPVTFTLMAKARAALVQVAGSKVWKPVQKRLVLAPGDKVRIKKGAPAGRVQMGETASLTLRGDTQVDLSPTDEIKKGDATGYALRSGSMQVSMQQEEGIGAGHELKVAGASVEIRPTLRGADVEVNTTKTGALLLVRSGEVHVNDAPAIEAGSVVELQEGKVVSVRALASSKVDVRARTSTVLYYDKKVPAINFVWSEGPTEKPTTIEVATDKDFKQIVAADTVTRGSLILDQLAAGRYFWRLDNDAKSRASLQIVQESETDCANCKRSNFIDDTGEKTVVYFQQSLPAIVLRWKEVESAKQYTLKVFADGEFDKPLFDFKTADTKKSFESGRFGEGKYYWLVAAADTEGREMATGRMNSLQITYDNAITSLVIRSPKQGQQIAGGQLTTTGEVELGARVFVNGKRVEVDENGRFTEALPLKPGSNQVVYRAVAGDGVERLYLRDVVVKH